MLNIIFASKVPFPFKFLVIAFEMNGGSAFVCLEILTSDSYDDIVTDLVSVIT